MKGKEKLKVLEKNNKNTVESNEKGNSNPYNFSKLFDINEILENIEVKYKVPFSLFIEGYKCNEIAVKLDIPVGIVEQRIFFTRKKLTNMLLKYL